MIPRRRPDFPKGPASVLMRSSTDPGGTEHVQPAFYHAEYLSEVREEMDWHYPTGEFTWKVRFSPNQVGEWRYRIVARDGGGIAESQPAVVVVVPSDDSGFIKVSESDQRYFEFDDGSLFDGAGFQLFGLLENPATQGAPKLLELQNSGVNFARFWVSHLFGSAWNPYVGGRNQYRGYLPVTAWRRFSIQRPKNQS